MRIQFAGEVFEFPPPIARKNDVLINTLKYTFFIVAEEENKYGKFNINNVKKVLFFILREGIGLTFNKVRAVLFRRKLGRSRALILALGSAEASGESVVGFGPQDAPFAEQLVFPASLTVPVDGERDFVRIHNALSAYLDRNPEIAEALFHWSPWSGVAPPVTLADALAEARGGTAADARPVAAADRSRTVSFDAAAVRRGEAGAARGNQLDIFIVGAGGYPCSYIIPCFRGADIRLNTVIDINPACAAIVAKRYGFLHADTAAERGLERLRDCASPVVIVATYHSTHLDVASTALAVNPQTRILIEKPPVTTVEQLRRLLALRRDGAYVEIGYNRRYSPRIERAKRLLEPLRHPVKMTCLIKELAIPPSHWYHWPNQGTRITGNLCHWLDLGCFLIPGKPVALSVDAFGGSAGGEDVVATVNFDDSSRLSLIASDDGNALRGVQELIDIRCGDTTLVIDDFLRLKHQHGPWQNTTRSLTRDKGHVRMYRAFLARLRENIPPEYPDRDLLESTALYLAATDIVSRDGGGRIDMADYIDRIEIPR